MVTLTRITGAAFALNPDLIERVDRTPDTVITLVDGTKYLVRESLEDVVRIVVDYRAQLINAAGNIEARTAAARATRLAAVPDAGDDDSTDDTTDATDNAGDATDNAGDAKASDQVVTLQRRTAAAPREP
jgi:flagellar protein FlbD